MDLLNVIFDEHVLREIQTVLNRDSAKQRVDMILWQEEQSVRDSICSTLFETMVTTRNGSLVTLSSMTMLMRLDPKHKDAFLADISTSLHEQDRQSLQLFAEKFGAFHCDARRIQKALLCDVDIALAIENLYEDMACDTFAFLQGVMSDTLVFDEDLYTEEDEQDIKSAIFSYLDEVF